MLPLSVAESEMFSETKKAKLNDNQKASKITARANSALKQKKGTRHSFS